MISAILGIMASSGFQSEVRGVKHFSDSTSEDIKLDCEILIVETEPVLLENEFDYREKPQQMALLPTSAHESTIAQ